MGLRERGRAQERTRRLLGLLAGHKLAVQVAMSIATAALFVGLHAFGLLGSLSLPVVLGTLAAVGAASFTVTLLSPDAPGTVRLWVRVGVRVLGSVVVIYAIGWGPMLALGLVVPVAEEIRLLGSRAWRPSVVWSVVGLAGGQGAVALGLPMYLPARVLHGLAVLACAGLVFGFRLLGTKAAETERATSELAEREESFRTLFERHPHPMWLYDATSLAVLTANEAAISAYGYRLDELQGMKVTELWPPGAAPDLAPSGTVVPSPPRQSRHRHKSGRIVEVELRSHVFERDGRPVVLLTATDVTAQRALEERLRRQALHDPLTGLPNRVLFADRAEHALAAAGRRGENVALVYLDLDGFKAVNDRFGHEAGDRVLVAVAERLRESTRAGDTLARLSGDEFVVLVEDADDDEGYLAAGKRVLEALRDPLCLGPEGEVVRLSASAGVALSVPGDTVEDLLRRADAAMYDAKADGKGCCVVATGPHPSASSATLARPARPRV